MGIPGLAVAVVRDGRIMYQRELGVQALDSDKPVDGSSLFHLASVTKLFTAVAIMQLAETGRLTLSDSLAELLPEVVPEDPRWHRVRLDQLLSHTGGLRDESDFGWEDPQVHDSALSEYISALAQDSLVSDPGDQFLYANTGYSVLGYVASLVAGDEFEDLVERAILAPLGMDKSSLRLEQIAGAGSLTQPHVLGEDYQVALSAVRPYSRQHAPSSTLYSSTDDLVRWLLAWTNNGSLDGAKLVRESTVRLMWTPAANTEGRLGLGWFLDVHRGYSMAFHSGLDLGYSSFLAILPDQRTGVVVLANYDRAPTREIALVALDWALGIPLEGLNAPAYYVLDQILYNTTRQSGIQAAVHRFQTLSADHHFDFNQVRRLLGLAATFRQAGEPENAAEIYRLCLDLYPDLVFLHELEAVAQLEAGDSIAARVSVDRALGLDSSSVRALELQEQLDAGSSDERSRGRGT